MSNTPIAIIGMACRMPGASTPEQFWRLLVDGASSVGPIPESRIDSVTMERLVEGNPGSQFGGFLDHIDQFDPEFFGISPREAAAMDPQQRLILELAWETIEDASIVPSSLRGSRCGVFVGALADEYAGMSKPDNIDRHTLTGTTRAVIANRVSYVLGLRGRSLAVDTAQSSSLVATQLACESLVRGDTELALAGGVNLAVDPLGSRVVAEFGGMSATGQCHTLDHRADGYVRGEGAGLVLLKRLDSALADGDRIYAVIRGGAVNNDGATDGLTVPNASAQADVIASARRDAEVDATQVQYVELHGTGTPLGDRTEVAGLVMAGDAKFDVGSVKTNVGHLEGAAGIAGLLKVVLALWHRQLPQTLNYEHPPTDLDLSGLRPRVHGGAWPRANQPLIAGVSSFGMGGTNCHLILGEAPRPGDSGDEGDSAFHDTGKTTAQSDQVWDGPLLVSAKTDSGLRAQAKALIDVIGRHDHVDVARALATTRTAFNFRAAITGDPVAGLTALAEGAPAPGVRVGRLHPQAFNDVAALFPGQGSQRVGMARAAYKAFASFRRAFDEVIAELGPALPQHVWDDAALLGRTRYTQPALFAVEVATFRLLESWGIVPTAVAGHSIGEIAAAHIAGIMDLSSAASLIVARGALMDALPDGGAMAAVNVSESVVVPLLVGRSDIGLGAVNGPESVVLSGEHSAVRAVVDKLHLRPEQIKWLRVSHAFHSPLMQPMLAEFAETARKLQYSSPFIPFVSSVTGSMVDHIDADYWVDHARLPVRFDAALKTLRDNGDPVLVEAGPGTSLSALGRSAGNARCVPVLARDGDIAVGVGELYTTGVEMDWSAIFGPAATTRQRGVSLPTYPFERQRYWLSTTHRTEDARLADALPPTVDSDAAPDTIFERKATEAQGPTTSSVLSEIAAVLGYADSTRMDSAASFGDLGVDSLGIVEIRDRLVALGAAVSTADLYSYPTPDALATHVVTPEPIQVSAPTDAPGSKNISDDPIVIVGMGCRYPGGVATPEQLWRLVSDGVDAIGPFPEDRGWNLTNLSNPDSAGASHARGGGFLTNAGGFDPEFFGMSPREALATDPQQRLLLQVTWEALERAGIDPGRLRGSSTGVYIGATSSDYTPRLHEGDGSAEGYLLTGGTPAVASGRIAYVLGLAGPALTIDTACSSSLVALDLAVRAVRSGTVALAIAGGASVLATPGMFVEFSRQGGLSADGRCRAFGADADGTGWAEGVGVLVVERLSNARSSGHPILAVIAGTAVNSDGASNGLTAPSGLAQQRVIAGALADAGLTPAEVDVVEAHGTGTTLGDPIEAQALIAAYGTGRSRPLLVGSLKSNIGHTQAAAGVGGVIKMVQALRHRQIPATLWSDEPTSHVDWSAGTVSLLRHQVPWPEDERPRRAGVSSFGISGTNAHVIVESAPSDATVDASGQQTVDPPVILSAPTAESLARQATTVANRLTGIPINGLAAVLAARTRHRHSVVFTESDPNTLGAALGDFAAGALDQRMTVVERAEGKTVFVFPGQGSQWPAMARSLLDDQPVFRAEIDRCAAALDPHTDFSLLAVLRGEPDAPALDRVDVIQPVLFATMVSLAALWRHFGVTPDAVVGHSQGEIAAAYVAGALPLADAARLVARRSSALTRITGHSSMMSVATDETTLRDGLDLLGEQVAIAADNGPRSVVVAGAVAALDELAAWCDARSIHCKRVAVDYASHTAAVDPLHDDLLQAFADATPRAADIDFYSSVTATETNGSDLDAEYWYRNLRQRVRFADTVAELAERGHRIFVEVSPHPVLTGGIEAVLTEQNVHGSVVPTLRRGRGESSDFIHAVAVADASGRPAEWPSPAKWLAEGHDIPTYAFDETRFWLHSNRIDRNRLHPLLDAVIELPDGSALATAMIDPQVHPWVAEHRVMTQVVAPATMIIELVHAAGRELGADVVAEMSVTRPLPVLGVVTLQMKISSEDQAGRRDVTVHARHDAEWHQIGHGAVIATTAHAGTAEHAVAAERDWANAHALDLSDFYDGLYASGYDYGPQFATVGAAWSIGENVVADIAVIDGDGFGVHPATLDAALHPVVGGLTAIASGEPDRPLLPFSAEGIRLPRSVPGTIRVWITPLADMRVRLVFTDLDDRWIGEMASVAFRPASPFAEVATYRVEMIASQIVPSEDPDQIAVLHGLGPVTDIVVGGRRTDDLTAATTVIPIRSTGSDIPAAAAELAVAVHTVLGRLLSAHTTDPHAEMTSSRVVVAVHQDDLAAATVIGLVRVAAAEHPGRVALAVVDHAVSAAELAAVSEAETRFIADSTSVPRLREHRLPPESEPWPHDGTILITGGTGALGTLVARHLADVAPGAHLLLAGRSASEGALSAELRATGTEVSVVACDVTERSAVAALIAGIDPDRPLRAVIHAAGVLDDATIATMTADQLTSVLAPKVNAAWHLHELTVDQPVERFVLFSSAVATLGIPGQGNYAAANTFLDVLAAYRRSLQMPATAIGWGLWNTSGAMTAHVDAGAQARLARRGLGTVEVDLGLGLLDLLSSPNAAGSTGNWVVQTLNSTALRQESIAGTLQPLLHEILPPPPSARATGDSWRTQLASRPIDRRESHLVELLGHQAAAVLGHDVTATVDTDRAFKDLGFDSLTAVELRNRVGARLGVQLPATVVFEHPSVTALARHLLVQFFDEPTSSRPHPAVTRSSTTPTTSMPDTQDDDPVVIVGMGCRYPGGITSPDDLWSVVASGSDVTGDFPTDRGWDLEKLYHPDPDHLGTTYTQRGGFLDTPGEFDAEFFGMSPREALATDPQHRLLLQVTWEALEHAGIDPTALKGTDTGVFVGAMYDDYASRLGRTPPELEGLMLAGNQSSVASGRIAYVLGLSGRALTVDTACSSSLVALDLAVRSVRSGECVRALAGGVAVMATPGMFVEFARQRGLSADGRCRAFADAADGTGWSEGVGMLVIERLSTARSAGHPVLAVVAGTAVNSDGASNGLTAPSGSAQERVVRKALSDAGIQADQVDVVEGHGTGTRLGDPIEVRALMTVYGGPRELPLLLGSLKSNIGHTQAAAGVGGVIKMVEAMRRGVVPKTLWADTPTSHVDWSEGRIQLLAEGASWPDSGRPRRAGVSSFGISGTNAHVILASAPPLELARESGVDNDTATTDAIEGPLLFSARSAAALRAMAGRLAHCIEAADAPAWRDVGHTLSTRRSTFRHRAAAADPSALRALHAGRDHPALRTGVAQNGTLAVLFSGQGSQYAGMGGGLLASSPVAAAAFDAAAQYCDPLLGVGLRTIIDDPEMLAQTRYAQPALFALELAGYAQLAHHRVVPTAFIGHSVGEIAAAHLAGVLDLPSAAELVVARGRLMGSVRPGAMAVIEGTETEVAASMVSVPGVEIAAVNSDSATVVSGDVAAVDALVSSWKQRNRRATRLRVAHAFHSAHLDDVADEFATVCNGLRFADPVATIISTVTGKEVDSTIATPAYWVAQMRGRVRFADAVRSAHKAGITTFVEIGPDGQLAAATRETLDDPSVVAVSLLAPRRDDSETVAGGLRALFVAGVDFDTAAMHSGGKPVDLPTYPFQNKRYWLPATDASGTVGLGLSQSPHPMLDSAVAVPGGGTLVTGVWSPRRQPWLTEHVVDGRCVAPASLLIDVMAAVGGPNLQDLTITRPVVLNGEVVVRAVAHPDGRLLLETSDRPDATPSEQTWTTHASALINPGPVTTHVAYQPVVQSSDVVGRRDDLYEALAQNGYGYGRLFRGMKVVWRNGDDLIADIEVPDDAPAGALVSPALLDAALHPMVITRPGAVPFTIAAIHVVRSDARAARVVVSQTGPSTYRMRLHDTDGTVIVSIDDFVLREFGRDADLYRMQWVSADPAETVNRDEVDVVDVVDAESARAVLVAAAASPDRLVIRTQGLPITPEDEANVDAAAAWGLVRVAQAEHPGRFAVLDQPTHPRAGSESPPAAAVAGIRGGRVLLPELVRSKTGAPNPPRAIRRAMITGGTGALGIPIARHLVDQHGATEVILVSRSGHTESALPEQVRTVACDVTDTEALTALVTEVGAVDLLIHAAGVADDAVVERLSAQDLTRALTVKAGAAAVLDRLTRDHPPFDFVLFGSVAAILGTAGQGAYAAANSALDAIAQQRRQAGAAATVIHWGLWDVADGMAGALSDRDRKRLADQGIEAMREADGLTLLDRVLAGESGTVIAANLNLVMATRQLRGTVTSSQHRTPRDSMTDIDQQVLAVVAAVLGHESPDDLDRGRPFTELGFDSLMAVDLRNRLAARFDVRLSTAVVFDHPTPTALIEHLAVATKQDVEPTPDAAAGQGLRGHQVDDDAIVIVGTACRLPGQINTPTELWHLLDGGTDVMSDFPNNRGWSAELFDPDPDHPGTSTVRRGGFLHDAADFDADFFGISPREAVTVDPQQRILLETAWDAIESAGIDPTTLKGSNSGVFVGVMYSDYGARVHQNPTGGGESEGWLVAGSAGSVASGRIAYTLGLHGPAVTVDTACSSSLVAIHQAAQALREGDCDLALAGGATVMSSPATFIEFSRQRGLAADGTCKPFSDTADGTAWSEGAGLLLLERMSDARRAGHRVLAVVAGTAVNSDGASNGLTAPNGPAQQRVIRRALAAAGVRPAQVQVLEAHGTGTRLGDPIEAEAVLATYGDREGGEPLLMGSVKSNLGHTQAAAGAVGVIKLIESMHRGQVPGTAHLDRLTRHVDWSPGSVLVPSETTAWPAGDGPRRAGVSSFGISGTNAHVILESVEPDPPSSPQSVTSSAPTVWTLSARTREQLRDTAIRLRAHLHVVPQATSAQVAKALSRRTTFVERAAVVGRDLDEMLAGLDRLIADPTTTLPSSGDEPQFPIVVSGSPAKGGIGLVFTGQGSQRVGMGAALAAEYPVFAAAFTEIVNEFTTHGIDVRSALDGATDGLLDQTRFTQAALFALEVALFRLLQSWGLRAEAVAGHSIGELAAAHISGAMALRDAVALVAARGTLMQNLPEGGTMISVRGVTASDATAAVADTTVDIAAINSPRSVVLSGPTEDVAELVTAHGWKGKALTVSHAFHSSLMDPMLSPFAATLLGPAVDPDCALFSTLTAQRLERTEVATTEHWAAQVRGTVRFADTVSAMAASGIGTFLEIGPDAALTAMVAETEAEVVALPSLSRGHGELTAIAMLVARGFVAGIAWDFGVIFGPQDGVMLPGYPFAKQRFWLDIPESSQVAAGVDIPAHPLLDMTVSIPGTSHCVYTGTLSLSRQPWLVDHVIGGRPILPAVAIVEMFVWLAGIHANGCVAEVVLAAPMAVPIDGTQVHMRVGVEGRAVTVHARSATNDEWTLHAHGVLADADGTESVARREPWNGTHPDDADPLRWSYPDLADRGYEYGPAFAALTGAWHHDKQIYADADSAVGVASLDAVLHAWLVDHSPTTAVVPYVWRDVRGSGTPKGPIRARLIELGPDTVAVDVLDEAGSSVLTVGELRLRTLEVGSQVFPPYHLVWVPAPGPVTSRVETDSTTVVFVDPAHSPRAMFAAIRQQILALPDAHRLAVVTRGAAAADPNDTVPNPAMAVVWGLIRTARSERPGQVSVIDVDGDPMSESILPAVVDSALGEVAIRGGQVLVPRVQRDRTSSPSVVFGTEGTVMVTGAGGALGSAVARHLVTEHGVGKLLLVSRRGAADPVIAGLVEELPAVVDTAACDLSDFDAVARLVQPISDLVGIVHAAGAVSDAVLENLTDADIDGVFGAKVDAAENLHRCTVDRPAVPLVLFSSLAGIVGNAGQANYAAANCYLDALAAHRRANGLAAVSMAWGLWETDEGMGAALDPAERSRIDRLGVRAATVAQGLAQFDAALADGSALTVPALLSPRPEGPEILRDLVPAGGGDRRGELKPELGSQQVSLPDQVAGLNADARRQRVRARVAVHIGSVLGRSAISVPDHTGLFDLGMDSLMAVELRTKLSGEMRETLPATLIFDYPSAADLTEFLLDRCTPEGAQEPNGSEEMAALESLIALAATGDEIHGEVVSALREALKRLDDPADDDFGTDSASDDELFGLLDSELSD